jgi:hypothetical protein
MILYNHKKLWHWEFTFVYKSLIKVLKNYVKILKQTLINSAFEGENENK